MARVHCPDCEMAVVVDPNGVCPEGHLIGNAGRRIELAIGDDTPHPDEPQPWSAMVEAAEAIEHEPEEARQIRPISIAPDDESEEEDDGDNEMMMRELHALSDLDVVTEERAVTGPASAPSRAETAPAETAPAETAPAWSADEAATDGPEISTAPVSESPPAPVHEEPDTPATAPAPRSDDDLEAIAELAALFDSPASAPTLAPAADQTSQDTPASEPHPTSGSQGSDEALASVSHLPYPSSDTAGASGATPPDGNDNLASGDSIDWSHFTARGKRRRFGR